ncbi:MAG TPA: DUF1573 domain-containing protein [Williamwhitmania sp.]|nr:DUF1573 domain-containing protein [Williamwhitmania sp.]
MKKFLILAVLAAFTGMSQVKAQQADTTKTTITFMVTEHSFGLLQFGESGVYKFEFTNAGATPLIVSNVVSGCGCTKPVWPKEPIMPGKTGEIEVGYNTSIVGSFNKSVTVFSNAKTSPIILRITGAVAPKKEN